MALWRKGCPRCGGDVFEETGFDGRSLTCLQCGRMLDSTQEANLRNRVGRIPATAERIAAA